MNFSELVFEKHADEIKAAMAAKVVRLGNEIATTETKIQRIWREHGIDDKAWAQILVEARRREQAERYSYGTKNARGEDEERTISGGEVQALLKDHDAIENHKSAIQRLQRLARNLADRQHKLSQGDLAYLDL